MPGSKQRKAKPWYDGRALPASGKFIVHRFIPTNPAHHGFFEVNFSKNKAVRVHLAEKVMFPNGPFGAAKLCLSPGFYPLQQYRFVHPNASDELANPKTDCQSEEESSYEGTPEPGYLSDEETLEPVVLSARKDDAHGVESSMGIGRIFRNIKYVQSYEEWQRFHQQRVAGKFESVESSKYPFVYSVNKIAKEYSQNKAFCNFRPGQEDEAREAIFGNYSDVSFEIPADAVNCNTFTQDVTDDLQAQSENFKKSITICGELGFDLSRIGKLLENNPQLQEVFLEFEINPPLRDAFVTAEKAGILSENWSEIKESEDPLWFVQKKLMELAIDAVIDNTGSSNKKAIGRFLKYKLQDNHGDLISIYNNLVRMASHVRKGVFGKRSRLKDDNLPKGFDKAKDQIELVRNALKVRQEDHDKIITERPKYANNPQYQTYDFFCDQMKRREIPVDTPLVPDVHSHCF
ncbi:hypothetical protein Psal006b_03299 (plasmid) [Piscirickettsia salmonis]|uniref:dTDP-glucose 4,6-dehydratase n=1 Tax=Piscirickettsia salmonis TaxID=1238 RepID=A0A1L6TI44_PISSA|nr:hypothetical protein [Piscirickettsia salmonis]AKP74909.1 hypothetical protein PSLF89_1p100 [Piscirickettsia salmonis LF-89 = ATCC VR-1361]ALB24678.1 dTDP-glucose 4,6-dehydratase [Piscirickettsia salmonis]ALY04541.1 hypothetical protein AWE47_16680 [Piscirickettsia salmonis]AMA43912.1 hypothetical protein AWJ11_16110 [Piscirickettsia salmonis]AOS37130.1 hypothetical protein AVM72_17440 [Piscirickettsia salmonis]